MYLTEKDTIGYGVYSGEKLGSVIKKYGRRVLLEIVKNNRVDDSVLKKYHYHHPATQEEKLAWANKLKQMALVQECNIVSVSKEETYETTTTLEMEEERLDPKAMWEKDYMNSVDYDPEDEPVDSSFYNPSLGGWIYHPFGGVSVRPSRTLND